MAEYDFRKDWMMIKAKEIIPKEIVSFLETTFLIMEIRERVGKIHGIKFEVRTKEGTHTIPHVHAEYDKYNVSIEIESGRILAGNLPHSQQKIASAWVVSNKEKLLGKWNDMYHKALEEGTIFYPSKVTFTLAIYVGCDCIISRLLSNIKYLKRK